MNKGQWKNCKNIIGYWVHRVGSRKKSLDTENKFNDCIEVTHGIVFSISSGNSKFNALESIEKCEACQ